jgi:ribosomal protein L27
MIGGFSTPKKDEALKISGGQIVTSGKILVRGINRYKAGKNVRGLGTLYAICDGTVVFTKKKTSKGSPKTFINIEPKK